MISHLSVKRIRSIHEVEDVPFAPLTVIVGPNGVGKSNLIHALQLGAQISDALAEANHAPADGRLPMRLADQDEIYGYLTTKSPELLIAVGVSGYIGRSTTIQPIGSVELKYRPKSLPESVSYTVYGDQSLDLTVRDVTRILGDAKFISTNRLVPNFVGEGVHDPLSAESLNQSLRVIRRSEGKRTKLLEIGRELFNLDWSNLLEGSTFSFTDRAIGPRGVSVPFTLASLGTQQFFPIVVHTLAAKRGGIVVTEEPEISLHPKAQVAIGEYFARRAADGVQIVITTHSHYLLQGVCKQVRSGILNPAHVAILNCRKERYGTKVDRLSLNEDGLVDGWIPSFTEVDDYLFQDWVAGLPVVGDESSP